MSLIFTALHCIVVWLISNVPLIVNVGSRFSVEEASVSIPLEERAELAPDSSVFYHSSSRYPNNPRYPVSYGNFASELYLCPKRCQHWFWLLQEYYFCVYKRIVNSIGPRQMHRTLCPVCCYCELHAHRAKFTIH